MTGKVQEGPRIARDLGHIVGDVVRPADRTVAKVDLAMTGGQRVKIREDERHLVVAPPGTLQNVDRSAFSHGDFVLRGTNRANRHFRTGASTDQSVLTSIR